MDEGELPTHGFIEKLQPYTMPIALGGVSIIAIAISIILLVKSTQTADPIRFSSAEEASGSALGAFTLTVDVEGAVAHPGVYTLPSGSRVEDAITAAGGLGNDVDAELFAKTINRATKIVDGAKLYVPKVAEDTTSHIISPLLRSPDGSPQNGLVSVNSASQSELESLPGVGPVTAQKIIANRPYQMLEELVSKKAIGPSLFDKLKNNLSL